MTADSTAESAVPTLADVVAALEARYDPSWAMAWDAVGLVCGDPAAPVRKVLLAVDPVEAVVDEAEEWGADLVLTHHPLFLTAVHGVAATTPKGRVVHRLLTGGRALFVAHTNADVADPGVSDALAAALGVVDLEPLEPLAADPVDKLVTFVPHDDVEKVFDALCDAGAGGIGDYTRASFRSTGEGTFLPGEGASPAIGAVGGFERVPETRLEMVLPRSRREHVVRALLDAHPYEEPAYDVLEPATRFGPRGAGRVGRLERPEPLAAFVDRVAAALPVGAGGVRAAGDPARLVSRVAVCGGAGDSYVAAARRSGADVYVTGDLRHHRTAEALDDGGPEGPALVDATHYGTEQPWLAQAARLLADDLAARGASVETRVSAVVTDPWTLHRPDA